MREKILTQLKAYLKTLGVANLSTARLNAIADKLALKITDEKDIDAKLEELNDVMPFADIAKQDDRLRTLEAKNKKPDPKNPDDDEEEEPEEKKPGKKKKDDVPDWAKSLLSEVQSLKAEKAQSTIRQKAAEKLKEIPEIIWSKRALPEKEDDLDDFITEVTNDWTTFKQDKKNEGLLGTPKPGGGNGEPVSTGSEEADIKAWADKTKPKETAKV